MKRVFYLNRDFQQMVGKHRGYLKPELFADALQFASQGLFDHYYGNTEEYRPGRPLPRVAYQLTTAVSDALHPFLREVVFTRTQSAVDNRKVFPLLADGGIRLPDGWVHPTSFTAQGAREAVQMLDDNEVVTTLNSLICPPTLEYPMAEVVPGGYKLHPATVPQVRLKYLAQPTRPVYAVRYPEDGGEPVYDDEKSVDTGWPESRHNQLLTRMLAYPGLALRDGLVQQIGQQLTDRGA